MFKSKIEPARLFDELKSLTANCPKHLQEIDESGNLKPEIQVWLGHLFALVEASGEIIDAERLRGESSQLLTIRGDRGLFAEREIRTILYRNLAKAELMAPVGVHGAFIPVGGAFDAFGAFAKIFGVVANDVLIVDPYLDEILLTDFLPLVPEKVGIRLLADLAGVKPSFAPAVSRWLEQFGNSRPIEAKVTLPRQLHDRLIIVDHSEVWIVTQSFKDFAARSPGSIERANGESSILKVEAYNLIWEGAQAL